jgi:hypothetical protein
MLVGAWLVDRRLSSGGRDSDLCVGLVGGWKRTEVGDVDWVEEKQFHQATME